MLCWDSPEVSPLAVYQIPFGSPHCGLLPLADKGRVILVYHLWCDRDLEFVGCSLFLYSFGGGPVHHFGLFVAFRLESFSFG